MNHVDKCVAIYDVQREDRTPEEHLLSTMTGLPWASINHQLLVNTS